MDKKIVKINFRNIARYKENTYNFSMHIHSYLRFGRNLYRTMADKKDVYNFEERVRSSYAFSSPNISIKYLFDELL